MIRPLGEGDLAAAREIWRLCFPTDSEAFISWFFRTRFDPRRSLGLFDGGLRSVVYFMPYELMINGHRMDANFIAGAATHPQAQGQHCMARLLAAGFELLHERGQAVTTLYPFNHDFYRKFGYEAFTHRLSCTFVNEEPTGEAVELTAPFMQGVYERMMRRFGAHFARSELLCAQRLEAWRVDGLSALAVEAGGAGRGAYALLSRFEGRTVVEELCYDSAEALMAMLRALPGGEAAFGIPVDDAGMLPRGASFEREPFAMLRAVDAQRLLGLFEVQTPCRVRLVDEQCPWNGGVYALAPGELPLRSQGGECDCELDARSLVRALFAPQEGLAGVLKAPVGYGVDQY